MPTMTIPEIRAELRRIAFDTKTPAVVGLRIITLCDELAEHFNVDPGRVSEVLSGKRGAR